MDKSKLEIYIQIQVSLQDCQKTWNPGKTLKKNHRNRQPKLKDLEFDNLKKNQEICTKKLKVSEKHEILNIFCFKLVNINLIQKVYLIDNFF